MTTWTEAQIDRHLHLWEHRHGPDSPEAGIVRQLRAERDAARGITQDGIEYFVAAIATQPGKIGYRMARIRAANPDEAVGKAANYMKENEPHCSFSEFEALVASTAALDTTQETPHE